MLFPVSGVETPVWVPPMVAFGISFFTAMGGVSGAFLLLPFQVSILGYSAPSVSATNQVFNIVAIPGGVYQYVKEGRMLWPLTWAVIIGTLPGVFIGAWVRIEYLPDPKNFKLFAGVVLLYIGVRIILDILKTRATPEEQRPLAVSGGNRSVRVVHADIRQVEFRFRSETFRFRRPTVCMLCFLVGIVGGVYGVGGGAIVAPFFVSILGLPVYAVAGAALLGTFITSVAGVIFYQILALQYTQMSVAPDWCLGALFGLGGIAGIYIGARCQKYVPARVIKAMLCVCVLFVAGKYIVGFF